jgi:GNAT superfamily N-acetyltransferase
LARTCAARECDAKENPLKEPAMPHEFRSAEPGDAPQLAPLFEQLGYPTEPDEIRTRLERRDETTEMLVATQEKKIVGFIGVAVQNDFITGTRGIILGLVVADGHRNEGIGAELLDAAEAWAFDRGARTILVRSNIIRDRAHKFYERQGYRRIKSQHIFEKRSRD